MLCLDMAVLDWIQVHLRETFLDAVMLFISALDNGGIGGMCLYHEMPSPDNPNGKCAYLMNIYTRPQFRRQGIGDAVVRWLIGQAEQRGISKIYLETSEAGKPLYREIGFTEMPDMMKLKKE